MIILALIGKFGALFSTIPDPVIGGVFCCMFGLITAVGISNLQHVNLNSVRNLFIIGFAIIMGLVIPDFLGKNEGVIDTGNPSLVEVLAKDKSTIEKWTHRFCIVDTLLVRNTNCIFIRVVQEKLVS